jgi:hypothetical protein
MIIVGSSLESQEILYVSSVFQDIRSENAWRQEYSMVDIKIFEIIVLVHGVGGHV